MGEQNMNKQLLKLMTQFTESQQEKANALLASQKDKHLTDYKILELAFEDDLVHLESQEVSDFYGAENVNYLTEVDEVIARIIVTLSHKTNTDVRAGYESSLVLDKSQPELTYLAKITEEYVMS